MASKKTALGHLPMAISIKIAEIFHRKAMGRRCNASGSDEVYGFLSKSRKLRAERRVPTNINRYNGSNMRYQKILLDKLPAKKITKK